MPKKTKKTEGLTLRIEIELDENGLLCLSGCVEASGPLMSSGLTKEIVERILDTGAGDPPVLYKRVLPPVMPTEDAAYAPGRVWFATGDYVATENDWEVT